MLIRIKASQYTQQNMGRGTLMHALHAEKKKKLLPLRNTQNLVLALILKKNIFRNKIAAVVDYATTYYYFHLIGLEQKIGEICMSNPWARHTHVRLT